MVTRPRRTRDRFDARDGRIVCPTGKVGMRRHVADERLRQLSHSTRRGGPPKRIYECPYCGAWHLTSKERPG